MPVVARGALHALDVGVRLDPRTILHADTSLLELAAHERVVRSPYVVVEGDGTVVGILQRSLEREEVA